MFKTWIIFSIKHIYVKVYDAIKEEGNKEIGKIIVDCNRRKEWTTYPHMCAQSCC